MVSLSFFFVFRFLALFLSASPSSHSRPGPSPIGTIVLSWGVSRVTCSVSRVPHFFAFPTPPSFEPPPCRPSPKSSSGYSCPSLSHFYLPLSPFAVTASLCYHQTSTFTVSSPSISSPWRVPNRLLLIRQRNLTSRSYEFPMTHHYDIPALVITDDQSS